MATVSEIKAQCEQWEQTQLPIIQKVQANYFAANKAFFQGIATPDYLPDDGKTLDADYTKKPTDQKETWAAVFKGLDVLPSKIPARTAIDVYEGPKGWGWTVSLQFHKEDLLAAKGVVYTRYWDYGPAGRSTGWIEEDWDRDVHPQPQVTSVIREAWNATVNGTQRVWKTLNTPIGDLWRA